MKRRKTRMLCLFSLMLAFILCTSCEPVGNETAGRSAGTRTTDEAAMREISVWHIWTSENDSNREAFNVAAEKLADENPGISLKVEVIETEIYKSKIRLAVAVNEAPDIFFSWGGGFSKPFVDSGKVLDVSSYMEPETKGRIVESALRYQTYDGKVYGLPFMTSAIILFANKEMFEQNHIKLPETYDDLLEAVKSFRRLDITPINVAEIELWPGMLWYDALALRTAGLETSLAALDKKASFDRPVFKEAAEKLVELVDEGAFGKNYMDTGYSEAIEPVRQGKVPMILMGSWACPGFEDSTSAVKGKIVPLNFPMVNGGNGVKNEYVGGAVDCWMVSAAATDKTVVVKAAVGIAEGMSREGYRRNTIIPVWKLPADNTQIPPLMKQVEDMIKNADGFIPAWDTYLEGTDAQTHLKLVADLMSHSATPEEFASKMQEINTKKQN